MHGCVKRRGNSILDEMGAQWVVAGALWNLYCLTLLEEKNWDNFRNSVLQKVKSHSELHPVAVDKLVERDRGVTYGDIISDNIYLELGQLTD